MQTIAITGASGFVGSYLTNYFEEHGHSVVPILRHELTSEKRLAEKLEQSDVLINLAGANILAHWSESYKKVMYDSRIETTRTLVETMKKLETPPKLFISTSAIGIYKNAEPSDEYTTK
jgi:NAD dependent epimerase/dehydratase family enzyme